MSQVRTDSPSIAQVVSNPHDQTKANDACIVDSYPFEAGARVVAPSSGQTPPHKTKYLR